MVFTADPGEGVVVVAHRPARPVPPHRERRRPRAGPRRAAESAGRACHLEAAARLHHQRRGVADRRGGAPHGPVHGGRRRRVPDLRRAGPHRAPRHRRGDHDAGGFAREVRWNQAYYRLAQGPLMTEASASGQHGRCPSVISERARRPGHRARLDPDQGRADRRRPRADRGRQPRLGEPVRRRHVDLLAGRGLGRPARRATPRWPRRPHAARGGAARRRRARGVRDDARLSRLRRRRRAAHAVPHLAQHQHRRRRRAAHRRSSATTSPTGGASPTSTRRSSTTKPHVADVALPDHPGRLRPLAAHRRASPRRRRRQRHVPDRHRDRDLRRDHARHVRPARAPRPESSSPWPTLLPAIRVAGQVAGHLTEGGARRLDPTGAAAARRSAVPARGRRRHGHGRYQLGRAAHGQRQRRHQHLRDGRPRAGRSAARTASSTWSPPRPATWSRWCTATTAPASSTPGSACSPSSPRSPAPTWRGDDVFEMLFSARWTARRRRRAAVLQLPLR